ncbi:hypothetical protein TSUD_120340 [Trifolium subterraneum]|uniref:NB-ARC domain-containing protein n=1 Tax=Trifolium subterraneum TaxID=3900 RepID=A0A2Z6MQ31_TRISU|nr:hypothetical protein TSUD_120340 [Trifolium subterraneum]
MAAELIAGAFLSSFFQFSFERLSSIKDLFNKGLVENLEITLNSINQLLDDAETKQYQNQNVKNWLDQLKHEVYEVDQLLDEIATNAQRKSKVRSFLSAKTNHFASRIKDLLDKLEHLANQKGRLGLKEGRYARNKEHEVRPKSFLRIPMTSLVDESSICGRKGDKEKIINFLLSDNGSSNQAPIISIVGLGGMGKTTLAQLVYNDHMIQKSFYLKAWVSVSESFDVVGLTKAILESFGSSPTTENKEAILESFGCSPTNENLEVIHMSFRCSPTSENLETLQRQLHESLIGKKYLLVLDDVWNGNVEIWERFLLPFNNESSGSKIIVTTRDREIAKSMNSSMLLDLERLDESDCWSLFVKLAFHNRNASEYPILESIGKNIVDKCGGLPLAVKTLGNLLRRKFSQKTLMLEKCYKLTELPLDFYKLVCLRHLYLKGTDIKKMPKKIGRLNHLQTLSHFVVAEKRGCDIKELGNLNLLQGKLCISGLEHVIDPADAAKANMKDKKHLEELSVNFGFHLNNNGRELDVLEGLEPNSNLKKLTIENYNGNHFPNWLMDCHLPNLVSLELKNCGLCSDLPSLDQLPLLKKLYISECPKLKASIPEGDSMIELHLEKCDWILVNGLSSRLEKLYMRECPKLKASIPKGDNMIELVLMKCDRILVNGLSSRLKKFVLWENRYTEFSVEENLLNCTMLEELNLDLIGFVNCPSLDLCCYNSLWKLEIKGCDSSSLPFSLHLFTNLRSLYLYDCPQLESFPRGGLPSNLKELTISNCPKLIGSREEWGLFQLNSLNWLIINDHKFENVESFPEENLLPPTLEFLEIRNCSKLRIMNNKGFLHLNSLDFLVIYNCPSLESLPEEGLQLSSLSQLFIKECPIIREKYKKEGGERWHTIRHIPFVRIY